MADKYGLEGFQTMQNHYNLLYREEEREMIPFCKEHQVGLIPWSPLARGFLTGKYNENQNKDSPRIKHDRYLSSRYFKNEDFEVVNRVIEIAQEKDVSAAQIALAWLFSKSEITALAWLFSKSEITAPILGVTKVEHLNEAVEALNIRLTDEDILRLEEVYIPHPIIGHS
jgi:aryl-alcohol dehydrogenase (NADP+)